MKIDQAAESDIPEPWVEFDFRVHEVVVESLVAVINAS